MNELLGIGMRVAEWMAKNKTAVLDVSLAVAGLTAAWGGLKILQGIKTMVLDLGKAFRIVTVTEGETTAVGVAGAETLGVAWRTLMMSTVVGIGDVALLEIATHWKQFEAGVIGVGMRSRARLRGMEGD